MVTLAVLMVSLPPRGMASRALTARFMMTCSIWPGSAFTRPSAESNTVESSTSSPIRRRNIFSMPRTTSLRLQHARLQHLFAAEGQQLAGQRSRRVRRPFGFPRCSFAADAPRSSCLQRQRAVTADDREQIVEIMRDAAGQPADGLHFLRLPQLFLAAVQRLLRAFRLGDVLDDAEHPDRLALFIHDDFAAALHDAFRAVRQNHAMIADEGLAGAQGFGHDLVDARQVLRMHPFQAVSMGEPGLLRVCVRTIAAFPRTR